MAEIKINDVAFTPRPDCNYKNDYLKYAYVIEHESEWHKALNVSPDVKLDKQTVERIIYRHLVLTDLFFIVYFVMGIKAANHPFWIKMLRVVEDSPKTKVLHIWARGHGKAYCVNEPVPVPEGWKNHGDLVPGDFVFHPSGKPIKVLAKTPVFHDEDCYKVVFSNGYEGVVSGDHLWGVMEKSRKRVPTVDRRFKENRHIEKNKSSKRMGRAYRVLSTREMAEKGAGTSSHPRFAIQYCKPIIMPNLDLEIDPYLLGQWLGNGTSKVPHITSHDDDAEFVASAAVNAGYTAKIIKDGSKVDSLASTIKIDVGRGNNRFTAALRKLELDGNKHVPKHYLRASIKQRLALLQGLMDSDGHCHECGTAYFVNVNEDIARGVFELASSLGIKSSFAKDIRNIPGHPEYEVFTVSFQANTDMPPFRIKRKADRMLAPKKDRASSQQYHYIKSIEPVPPEPVSCITVDAEDGLYVIGKHFIPTHNSVSITIAQTTQFHLANPEKCTCIFSYKKPAAEKFLGAVKANYEKPFLRFLFPEVLWEKPDSEAPSWSVQNGISLKRKNDSRANKTVEASGLVEGMLTGGHFERRIYDDIETADSADSPDEQEKILSRFDMSSNLDTKSDDDIEIVIGTFYSHQGPNVKIKDKKLADGTPYYHSIIIPGTDDGTREGTPVLMSQKKLEEEKTKEHFDSQILCDPTPFKSRKLNSTYLIDIEPEMIPRSVLKFMIIDPAGEANGKKGCDWAVMILGVDPKPDELGASNVYLVNAFIDQLSEAEAPEVAARMYLTGGIIQKVGVEKVAQSTAEIHFANALAAHGRRVSRDDNTLVILSPKGRKKPARIEKGLAWPLNNGKLHMSLSVPKKYREKIRLSMDQFPFGLLDGIDAWSYLYDEEMMNPDEMRQMHSVSTVSFKREGFKMKTNIA